MKKKTKVEGSEKKGLEFQHKPVSSWQSQGHWGSEISKGVLLGPPFLSMGKLRRGSSAGLRLWLFLPRVAVGDTGTLSGIMHGANGDM